MTKASPSFAKALEAFMARSPHGKLTISELARQANVPRSTVHRHLKGGKPIRATLAAYAPVLGVDEQELLQIAGYRDSEAEGVDDEARAFAVAFGRLNPETRRKLWQLMDIIEPNWNSEDTGLRAG